VIVWWRIDGARISELAITLRLRTAEPRTTEQRLAWADEARQFIEKHHEDDPDRCRALLRQIVALSLKRKELEIASDLGDNQPIVYSDNSSPSRTGGASRPSAMGEPLTDEELDLLALFRKLPEGRRGGVLDLVRSASGEVTLAPDGENLSSTQLAAVVSNSTLGRLRRRYAVLLKTPVLALSETHHHCEENRTRKVPF
jgi:hypothetical protein